MKRKRAIGIVLLALELPVTLLVLTEPPTWSGAAYVLGLATLTAALLVAAPWPKRVALAGVALIVTPLVVRLFTTREASDVRVINRLLDERDVSVNAARAIRWTHAMHDPDVPALSDAMRAAYDEMAQHEGSLPSPFVATYLGLERPGASDTIVFPVKGDAAVVFLHGFAGNFTMSCWLFARAAQRADMTTVCPSTRWVGDWWTADGEAIARETIASVRASGKKRIYLAGLSNGAIGATRLAPKLAAELAGLLLLSGADPDAPSSGLPTLAIQGRTDAQIPASIVQAYATRSGAHYVELEAGHFVMLLQRDRVAQEITTWLSDHK